MGKEKGQIEVYRQPESGVYRQMRIYSVGETLLCASVPGLEVALAGWLA